jgi:hypothetical protein
MNFITRHTHNWFAAIVTALIVAVVCCSCTTTPSGPVATGAVDSAYWHYKRTNPDATDLIAMVSYLSVEIQAMPFNRQWADYSKTINTYYAEVERTGKISENYPIKPTAKTLASAKHFTGSWLRQMVENDRDPWDGKDHFASSAAKLIFMISDREYNKDQ